jgi:hypothetical protein
MYGPRTFTAAVYQGENGYTAQCLEINISTSGTTVEEALHMLPDAVARHLRVLANPEAELNGTPAISSFDAIAFRSFRVPGVG